MTYSLVLVLAAAARRHEKPTDPDDPLADQNIKDRYYGINDPVADKLLKRASTMPRLDAPEDKSITTLYIGGLGDTVTDSELKYGPLEFCHAILHPDVWRIDQATSCYSPLGRLVYPAYF